MRPNSRWAMNAYYDRDGSLGPNILRNIMDGLKIGTEPPHIYTLGWAALELAQHTKTPPESKPRLLNIAEQSFRQAASKQLNSFPYLPAVFSVSFMPLFRNAALSPDYRPGIADLRTLDYSLRQLQETAIRHVGNPKIPEDVPKILAAGEAAIMHIGAIKGIEALVEKPSDQPEIAWPAFPWQRHRDLFREEEEYEESSQKSFGVLTGQFPNPTTNLRLKYNLYSPKAVKATGCHNEAALRQYYNQGTDTNTITIFTIPDLAGSPDDPLYLNRLILDDKDPQRERAIEVIYSAINARAG